MEYSHTFGEVLFTSANELMGLGNIFRALESTCPNMSRYASFLLSEMSSLFILYIHIMPEKLHSHV